MQIADLMKKKRQRVKVRVPASLQDKLGAAASGTVVRLFRRGSIAWVLVKVKGSGEHEFRPQDLSLA
ncbi:MAG: hypothetical protein DRH30_04865 [Deltaproteobacteria bacterium]|nr:MAG: hypothetical protein DRH30_04865 [Deltaproteobacteria bacterium]